MPDTARMKPEFAVHLDGKKLQGEEAGAILGIRVYQTRGGASSFELVVSDPELKWQGKPTFTECKQVKIDLGVPGKLKTVFDGEVTAWRTELERFGPTVLVVRGLDRSHRMMRGHKTRTYPNATPLDVAQQIAGQYGLTAKTSGGSPAPVKAYRFQANQSDYEFLAQIAQREGYMFWIDGSDLHFERPQIPTQDDCEFAFGEGLKAFLPVANFRKPPTSVEVSGWDSGGKAKVAASATKGQGLWSLPGGKPGAEVSSFTQTKVDLKVVDAQIATRDEAETVAKAALTRQSMEFLTGEVEVQGDPAVRPGAMVNLKKVGAYSGHYLVTEANHFYDAGGYHCIFYVARDKWGNSSAPAQQQNAARRRQSATSASQAAAASAQAAKKASQAAQVVQEGIQRRLVDEDTGDPFTETEYEITLHGGEKRRGKTDAQGYMLEEDVPKGNFTVRVLIEGPEVFAPGDIQLVVEDAEERVVAQDDAPNLPIEMPAVRGVSALTASPARLFQGDKVTLSADVDGADEATLVFRVFRMGDQALIAEVTARVLHGSASAEFEVPEFPPDGQEDGFDYADFEIEAECAAIVVRSELMPAFRAFRSGAGP